MLSIFLAIHFVLTKAKEAGSFFTHYDNAKSVILLNPMKRLNVQTWCALRVRCHVMRAQTWKNVLVPYLLLLNITAEALKPI